MNQSRIIAAALLLFYLVVRFALVQYLDALGHYASYVFEGLFVTGVMVLYRARIQVAFGQLRRVLPDCVLALPLGFGVFKLAIYLGILIPFDLADRETILLLLIVAPLLEECIFRQALWHLTETLWAGPVVTLGVTSSIFAFAHFHAYFFVPAEVQQFMVYQTFYALVVGVWWGFRYMKTRSLAVPIALHVIFNLGFYLGFVA